MIDINWQAIAGALTSAAIICAVAFMLLRARLAAVFVTRSEFEEKFQGVDERLDKIDAHVNAMPQQEAILALTRRVGSVESGVAVVAETANGIKEAVGRMERQVNLILQSQLEREKVR